MRARLVAFGLLVLVLAPAVGAFPFAPETYVGKHIFYLPGKAPMALLQLADGATVARAATAGPASGYFTVARVASEPRWEFTVALPFAPVALLGEEGRTVRVAGNDAGGALVADVWRSFGTVRAAYRLEGAPTRLAGAAAAEGGDLYAWGHDAARAEAWVARYSASGAREWVAPLPGVARLGAAAAAPGAGVVVAGEDLGGEAVLALVAADGAVADAAASARLPVPPGEAMAAAADASGRVLVAYARASPAPGASDLLVLRVDPATGEAALAAALATGHRWTPRAVAPTSTGGFLVAGQTLAPPYYVQPANDLIGLADGWSFVARFDADGILRAYHQSSGLTVVEHHAVLAASEDILVAGTFQPVFTDGYIEHKVQASPISPLVPRLPE